MKLPNEVCAKGGCANYLRCLTIPHNMRSCRWYWIAERNCTIIQCKKTLKERIKKHRLEKEGGN